MLLSNGLMCQGFTHLGEFDSIQIIGQLKQRCSPVIGIDPIPIGFVQIEDVLNAPEDA